MNAAEPAGEPTSEPTIEAAIESLRLAFGTLTVLPVRAPSRVDRHVAGRAMALAPLVGTALGLVGGGVAWLTGVVLGPLLAAVLVVVAVGSATRLIHWDGLADTADGLGSGRPAGEALEVMRRSDIGPFGVFAVVSVFAVQVVALADLVAAGAFGGVVVAVVLGRVALLFGCRAGVPAARPDGLGAAVAGSVGPASFLAGAVSAVVATVVVLLLDPALAWPPVAVAAVVSALWAWAATALLARRLAGMTGDTLGALVETTTAVALVVLAAS